MEDKTQIYKLDDTTTGAFEYLVEWLYSQHFSKDIDSGDIMAIHAGFKHLIELWVLAEKLLIPALQNAVILEIAARMKSTSITPTTCLNYVYENTAKDSQLRRFVVRLCAWELSHSWLDKYPAQFPKELLIEMVQMLSGSMTEKTRERKGAEMDQIGYEVAEPEK